MKVTSEELESILDGDSQNKLDGCHVFEGLKILSKYTSDLITGADHDEIYSSDVSGLIDAGITKCDCEKLRDLGWMVNDGEYLAHYVRANEPE